MRIETERLILRPFSREDGEAVYEMLSDPETLRFEPYPPLSRGEAYAEAAERAENPDFLAVCKKDDTLIGSVFFSPCAFEGAELAYLFDRRYWGNGYAYEACRARITEAFEKTDTHRVLAMCDPENTRSVRLLERLGLRKEGHFRKNMYFYRDTDGNPIWRDTLFYAILKDEWTAGILPKTRKKKNKNASARSFVWGKTGRNFWFIRSFFQR